VIHISLTYGGDSASVKGPRQEISPIAVAVASSCSLRLHDENGPVLHNERASSWHSAAVQQAAQDDDPEKRRRAPTKATTEQWSGESASVLL